MATFIAKLVQLLTPKRRWAQFSLSTTFVVVTVLCVWLAVVVNRASRQREAVAAITARDGLIVYDSEQSQTANTPWRERLRPIVGSDYMDDVVEVYLYPNEQTVDRQDERFHAELKRRHIREYSRLVAVAEVGPAVDDEFLKVVAKLTELEVLSLDWNDIGDTGLAYLETLTKLRWLHLQHTNVMDSGLAALVGLGQLESLWLKGTDVTDTGLVHLHRMTRLSQEKMSPADGDCSSIPGGSFGNRFSRNTRVTGPRQTGRSRCRRCALCQAPGEVAAGRGPAHGWPAGRQVRRLRCRATDLLGGRQAPAAVPRATRDLL